MLKFVLVALISMMILPTQPTVSHAGWAKRAAAACLAASPCRKAVMTNGAMAAGLLAKAYGRRAGEACLRSPACVARIQEFVGGITSGAVAAYGVEALVAKMGDIASGDESSKERLPDLGAPMPNPDDDGDPEFRPSRSKLQHSFDRHKSDWGFAGKNMNNQTLAEFETALRSHMSDPTTIVKVGRYRTAEVVHFYNPRTGLWLAKGTDGNLAAAFRLGTDQVANLIRVGVVR